MAAALGEDDAGSGHQVLDGPRDQDLRWLRERRDLTGDLHRGAGDVLAGQVAALAQPAEILVSRTVKDLVTGSGILFAERGSHPLNGPADQWPLFAVTGLAATGPRTRAAELE